MEGIFRTLEIKISETITEMLNNVCPEYRRDQREGR
jgi:hypothetical protein